MLRSTLDKAGLRKVLLIGPEEGCYNNGSAGGGALYMGLNNFDRLANDPAYSSAIGAFACHSYYSKPFKASIDTWVAGCDLYPAKDRWMTELSYFDARATEGTLSMGITRRLIADMAYVKNNYWIFWRGWEAGRTYLGDGEELTDGDGINTLNKSLLYYILQKVFTNVPAGKSHVRRVTSDDPGLVSSDPANMDMVAFNSKSKMVLLATNPTGKARPTNINGFVGAAADIFQSVSGGPLLKLGTVAVSKGTIVGVNLPADSITVIVSTTKGKAGGEIAGSGQELAPHDEPVPQARAALFRDLKLRRGR